MCLDPTIFFTILSNLSALEIVVGALLGVLLVLLASYIDHHSTPRRTRALDEYRHDVYQVQQAAQRERTDAADECLHDLYRLIRKR